MAFRKATDKAEMDIKLAETGKVSVALVGIQPLICNALPAKARRELLLPAAPKNRVARAQTLKHDPEVEYRASVRVTLGDTAPTRLSLPAPAVKGAMMNAALDIPGATKTQMGRLTWVNGYSLPLWGVPQIYSTIVRLADPGRTPDVRTRAILPRWATVIEVGFLKPNLNDQSIVNLIAAGGLLCGLGDNRQEKGKASFGQYRVANVDDPDFLDIVNDGGREAQDAALANPQPYDSETEELLSWFMEEIVRRQGRPIARPDNGSTATA